MTRVIELNPSVGPRVSQGIVSEASSVLRNGHVIAVPTDTIYGIASLVQLPQAIRTLYGIKKRNPLKPVAICVADIADIPRWSKVTIPNDLLCTLLPGPVTLVFERTPELNAELNPGTILVGVRIPDHDLLRSIVRKSGGPLALTSANLSAAQSTLDVKEFEYLWPHLKLVVDGGRLGDTEEARLGSTVVDLSRKGFFRIIRTGSAYEETRSKLEKFKLREDRNGIC